MINQQEQPLTFRFAQVIYGLVERKFWAHGNFFASDAAAFARIMA